MFEINGKYNTARVFTNELEPSASGQIEALCNQEHSKGSKIRIMPDCHAGAGCTIGTTMTISDHVVPNLVGVDIGCGMLTVLLKEKRIDLPKLDSFIQKNIPYGRDVREVPHRIHETIDIEKILCYKQVDTRRAKQSLGSLGGGNHFIEVDTDGEQLYLVIHTGSRNLGKQVAEYYQKIAYDSIGGRSQNEIPYELAPLSEQNMADYLHDMEIMQQFAALNRQIIKEVILDGMKLHETDSFETIHNYIDIKNMILRKGAVSAQKGEKLLIPMNMRDGSLICTGLGNTDWNCSAPHGAGRRYSRSEAKNMFTVSEFKKEMNGIFSTTVSAETLDECPMTYKSMDEIMENIVDTVTVDKVIKPIYNFKAGEFAHKKR
ncbi:MAG: RtcB family protein [Clostridium sp.]|nr:RtcB family protein [Clostridium sp.]